MVRRQIFVGAVLACLIVALITGIYYGTRIESKQIKGVQVVGGQTIPHRDIEQIVNNTLVGHYYRLVPKRFTWTYPKTQIVNSILAVDRVKNVQVELSKKELVVVFDEHTPEALWCDEGGLPCLFMDRSGYAFAEAPELSGGALVRYVATGVKPEKDTSQFTAEFITANEVFIEQLADELGLYITQVVKGGEDDIDYKVSGGGIIKTSQLISLPTTFSNLKTILLSEEFAHLEPGSFQYIDLRFGDKVFVNEELPSLSSATSTGTSTD